jgi:transcription-repair coupling factor (superfamily II helicase)
MGVRLQMKRLRATRLEVTRGALVLTFAQDTDVDGAKLVELVESHPGKYRFSSENRLKVRPDDPGPLASLEEIRSLLGTLSPEPPP